MAPAGYISWRTACHRGRRTLVDHDEASIGILLLDAARDGRIALRTPDGRARPASYWTHREVDTQTWLISGPDRGAAPIRALDICVSELRWSRVLASMSVPYISAGATSAPLSRPARDAADRWEAEQPSDAEWAEEVRRREAEAGLPVAVARTNAKEFGRQFMRENRNASVAVLTEAIKKHEPGHDLTVRQIRAIHNPNKLKLNRGVKPGVTTEITRKRTHG